MDPCPEITADRSEESRLLRNELDRVRHGLQARSQFPRIDLASDVRLENRIGFLVTIYALKAIEVIGVAQGFPSPRHFRAADFRCYPD
jgi:hypothetical protein